jgi:transposase
VSKYSYEFKLKVVKYCIKGKHGDWDAAKHFNIPSRSIINTWVRKYQKYGVNGLKHNCRKYTGQFKQDVIEYMHNHHLSLTETSIKFNLSSDSVIRKWERIYYEEGPQALYEERRGKNKTMSSKPRKKELSKENEEDLIEEVQRLRMENAYLKKLQALIQERTKSKQEQK